MAKHGGPRTPWLIRRSKHSSLSAGSLGARAQPRSHRHRKWKRKGPGCTAPCSHVQLHSPSQRDPSYICKHCEKRSSLAALASPTAYSLKPKSLAIHRHPSSQLAVYGISELFTWRFTTQTGEDRPYTVLLQTWPRNGDGALDIPIAASFVCCYALPRPDS